MLSANMKRDNEYSKFINKTKESENYSKASLS